MSHHLRFISKRLALAGCAAALLGAVPARSAVTDISNTPLASAANMSVLPNVMFILDDSGSMHFDGMPDNIENNQGASEKPPSSTGCTTTRR
jgi:type IV pilus assembly protein PilY1